MQILWASQDLKTESEEKVCEVPDINVMSPDPYQASGRVE